MTASTALREPQASKEAFVVREGQAAMTSVEDDLRRFGTKDGCAPDWSPGKKVHASWDEYDMDEMGRDGTGRDGICSAINPRISLNPESERCGKKDLVIYRAGYARRG